MALGRRSRRSERAKLDATPPWQQERVRDHEPTTGPFDDADAPEDEVERLDLGTLRVPVVGGVEVRVEVGPDGVVRGAMLAHGGSEMQLGVFAAPRGGSIWDDVRKELRAAVAGQGGTAQDKPGTFGTELTGRVPVQGGYQQVRFAGVDGPRWLVQALFTGPAAADPSRAAVLEDALRNLIVVRGDEPMPVREPLPMRLPSQVAEQMGQQPGAPAGGAEPAAPAAPTPAAPAAPTPAAGPRPTARRPGATRPAPADGGEAAPAGAEPARGAAAHAEPAPGGRAAVPDAAATASPEGPSPDAGPADAPPTEPDSPGAATRRTKATAGSRGTRAPRRRR